MMKHDLSFYFKKPIIAVLKQFVRGVAFIWPRDKNLIAFGAWHGVAYKDSPKYLAEWMLQNTNYKVVWVGNAAVESMLPKHIRLSFAKKGTFRAVLSLLRAKVWVCCISIDWDFTWWPLEGGAIVINTRHGYGMKRVSNRVRSGAVEKASIAGRMVDLLERHIKTYALIGSDYDAKNLLTWDGVYFDAKKMLPFGTPAVDFLIANKNSKEAIARFKKKYAEMLGFDQSQKIVTYFPTWRDSGAGVGAFGSLPEAEQLEWQSLLMRENAVIIEKHHPRTLEKLPIATKSLCSIPISAAHQNDVDVHELLLITDILISDYSGASQEYGIMQRPCVHFAYDWDEFTTSGPGLVEGWQFMLSGPVIKTWSDLYVTIEEYLSKGCFQQPKDFSKSTEYQTGHACEQILKFIQER